MMKKILFLIIMLLVFASLANAEDKTGFENDREEMFMKIRVGEHVLTVRLADNDSARALTTLLADGPLTIPASNYGGFEKVCPLGILLPSSDVQTATQPGDVMLYASSQIVIFHGNNDWAYTRLGWIEDRDTDELRAILGGNDDSIVLSCD